MSRFEALGTLVMDRPAVEGLGTSVIGQEFAIVGSDDLVPLAAAEQAAFLADSVPPTGQANVAAFNSKLVAGGEEAFQSYLEGQQ